MTEDQPEIEKHEKDIISATLQDVQFDHEGRPSVSLICLRSDV